MRLVRHYVQLRDRYQPRRIRAIFVLESPPVSGKYFYEAQGSTGEPLFRAMMQLLGIKPLSKLEGLRAFQRAGYILIDAIYQPVNKMNYGKRNAKIVRNVPNLVRDLRRVGANRRTPILLVKTNVCKLLGKPLMVYGFNVLNRGVAIPFPSHGWQGRFSSLARQLLRSL